MFLVGRGFHQPFTWLTPSLGVRLAFAGGAVAAGTGLCGWGKVQGEERLVQRDYFSERFLSGPSPSALLRGSTPGSARHHSLGAEPLGGSAPISPQPPPLAMPGTA